MMRIERINDEDWKDWKEMTRIERLNDEDWKDYEDWKD